MVKTWTTNVKRPNLNIKEYKMTSYKIHRNYAQANGYEVAKKAAKVTPSERETFPVTQLGLGDALFVSKYTARDLRNIAHQPKGSRKNMRFRTVTEYTRSGSVKGAYAIRVK